MAVIEEHSRKRKKRQETDQRRIPGVRLICRTHGPKDSPFRPAWGPAGHTVVVSHKTRDLSSFFAPFVTSHLRQNRTDERSFHVGWILPKIPHEKGDRARHNAAHRSSWILLLSMDPHNRRGSASFSTFLEDQPSHKAGEGRGRERNNRDLLPSNATFLSAADSCGIVILWNVSIHKLE